MDIHNDVPPPAKRERTPRMTDEIRAMKPGQSVITCPDTARAIHAYFRYHGIETVRRTVDVGKVQTWRL